VRGALDQREARRGPLRLAATALQPGFLTGKYQRGAETHSARAEGIKSRYFNDRGWTILDKLQEVAHGRNLTPTQTALAWLLSQPVITSPIIGANSVDQLRENLGAAGVKLADEEMAALNEVSKWE
jgi:aryl-alcohol dehydrogenase-like predicted oxidoreductase